MYSMTENLRYTSNMGERFVMTWDNGLSQPVGRWSMKRNELAVRQAENHERFINRKRTVSRVRRITGSGVIRWRRWRLVRRDTTIRNYLARSLSDRCQRRWVWSNFLSWFFDRWWLWSSTFRTLHSITWHFFTWCSHGIYYWPYLWLFFLLAWASFL